tara:strand:+ start:276 stop:494 length:219 start_codon:yes stop_codon:yes gene_type:complete
MTLPGMSDGRCFTSFMPNCQMNEFYKNKYNSTTNNEYRQYLQENALEIMDEFKNTCENETVDECTTCWNVLN